MLILYQKNNFNKWLSKQSGIKIRLREKYKKLTNKLSVKELQEYTICMSCVLNVDLV